MTTKRIISKRDRCYQIPTADGKGSIRVQAGRKPNAAETKVLQLLFEAAFEAVRKGQTELEINIDVTDPTEPTVLNDKRAL